jgi:hypothetical protein
MNPPFPPAPVGVLELINQWIKVHFVGVLVASVALGALAPQVGLALKEWELFRVPGTTWIYDFPSLALGLMMLSASTIWWFCAR